MRQFEERLWPVVHILPFNQAAVEAFGNMFAGLERTGTPVAELDLRIDAIALTNDLTVVTGSVRHFARIPGLQVKN